MRWRAAAGLALIGIAAIPGVSDARLPATVSSLHVSVEPASGSPATHFVVAFKAAQSTAILSGDTYRVTASGPARAGCQASIAVMAPRTHAGDHVRVKLAPKARGHWCAGTFRGQVWNVLIPPCPTGKACPAVVVPPQVVGRFTFRVKRG